MASLSLQGIQKIYPNGFHAVKDFNLEIEDKEEKPEGIFFSVGGVKKSFYQQKTENRESQSSNASQHLVNLRAEKTGRIGEGCRQLIIIGIDYSVLQDYCAYMVDEHENKSK